MVLAGAIVGDQAELALFGLPSFADANGQYILATPTDGDGPGENERSGVWWTFIPRSQSLVVPDLPESWIYEHWYVIDGQPVAGGTFRVPFGQPDDAAPYSGPDEGPPVVGEDFLVNAPDGLTFPVDLRGMELFITVEPFPDTGPEPFTIEPLRGTIPDDAIDHTHYAVENTADNVPSGTATLTERPAG